MGNNGRSAENGISSTSRAPAQRPSVEALEPRLLLDGAAAGQQAIELLGVSGALFAENQGQWADLPVYYAYDGSGANTTAPEADATDVDFGDAPSPYPTLLASDGARHDPTGPTLGANRDTESDGQPTADADGDDTTGAPDDEDGVIVPVLIASTFSTTSASVTVDLQNADPSANRLDAWVDFNQDGDWDDLGEQVFTSYDLGTSNGSQTLSFTVPRDTGGNIVYGTSCARFRLSTAGGLLPTGLAGDGEVEDYRVAITWFSAPSALEDNSGADSVPQVTSDGAGNWVAVWQSRDSLGGTIGTDMDIMVSRSADDGGTWTAAAPLNTNAGSDSGQDSYPQVTTDGAGNWVAVWCSNDNLDGTIGTDWDIMVSRSADAGGTWSAAAALNTNAGSESGDDWNPQVTTDGVGNWVAVWESDDSLGGTVGTDPDILVTGYPLPSRSAIEEPLQFKSFEPNGLSFESPRQAQRRPGFPVQ